MHAVVNIEACIVVYFHLVYLLHARELVFRISTPDAVTVPFSVGLPLGAESIRAPVLDARILSDGVVSLLTRAIRQYQSMACIYIDPIALNARPTELEMTVSETTFENDYACRTRHLDAL